MLGTIIGDMIGSTREGWKTHFDGSGEITHYEKNAMDYPPDNQNYRYDEIFPEVMSFTDDSVLMIATGTAIINNESFADAYRDFFEVHSTQNELYKGPGIGYGMMFMEWAEKPNAPAYRSYGNGSAMRAPAIGYLYETLPDVLNAALRSAECTHNHPEGIKGAQAVAVTVWLARQGVAATDILSFVKMSFYPEMDFDDDTLIKHYVFNPTCQGSVPQAIWLALTSSSFEEVIVRGLKIGGDTDTICAMAGGIAEPLFGIPDHWKKTALTILERDGPFLAMKYEQLERRIKGVCDSAPSATSDELEKPTKKSFWRALLRL
jgi:ADP-ribosylglycohydrolase